MTEDVSANDNQSNAPAAKLRAEAFAVLVDAVGSLATDGFRPPTASEVRLEMKRRTYGGFDPKLVGFKRFRDFLMAAATEGHVHLDLSRPGDVAVLRVADADLPRESSHFIRPDLWRAFVDWDLRMLRFYDKTAGKAQMIPREPAPFEPERYLHLRRRLQQEPEAFIEIHPVEMPKQLAWMREHAEQVSDPELRPLLLTALDSEKPLKLFVDILRTNPPQLARWHRDLGEKVRQEVEKWRDSVAPHESIEIERREPPTKDGQPVAPPHTPARIEERPSAINVLKLLKARRGPSATHGSSHDQSVRDGAELRARLHLAIDQMPLSELKTLRIPVGYLFED
ncbi:UPF0158 family protein [Micromonospora sp. IBSANI012]|uniref:UPF0158 family protein n=1 Tax=Micromonospora sp. IBSANI012 TaxID=3457761 RepID=UPI004058B934